MRRTSAVFWLSTVLAVLVLSHVLRGSLAAQTQMTIVGTAGVGGGHSLQEEGSPLPARPALNFVGPGVQCTDNPGANATVCTVPGDTLGYVPENSANKSTSTALGPSDVQYPSQKAVRDYVTTTPKALTNTGVTPRPCTAGPSSPITINVDNVTGCDFVRIADLSGPTTFTVPAGIPVDGQFLTIVVYTPVQRAVTFTTGAGAFSGENGVLLPTFTRPAGYVLWGFRYNSQSNTWAFSATSQTTNYGVAGQVQTSNGPGVEPSWQAAAGGGKGYVHLPVGSVTLPLTDPARIDGSGDNVRLLFDASTQQCAWWGPLRMNGDYASAPVFKFQYSMTSATSGGVSLDISVVSSAPGSTDNVHTKAYASANNCDSTPVPNATSGDGRMKEMSCPLTSTGGLAAGALFKVQVCRAVADGADDASGFLEGLTGQLEYNK